MDQRTKSYWVIIPCHNEEDNLPTLLKSLQLLDFPPQKIIVVDNNSNDNTHLVAERYGAIVLNEPVLGYGSACKRAIQFLRSCTHLPEVVVFMDGDNSDHPGDIRLLLDALDSGCTVALGSRTLGKAEPGSLTLIQRFGNALSCRLLRLLYGAHFTDLGPFRAVRTQNLLEIDLKDRNYGWTIELQIKLAEEKIPWKEVPVRYRKRSAGISKISENPVAILKAGLKIFYTIFYWYFYYRMKKISKTSWTHFLFLLTILFLTGTYVSKSSVIYLSTGVGFSYFILLAERGGRKKFYIITGILLRSLFLFTEPRLSEDYKRTIWDALLILKGHNPYSKSPEEIAEFHESLYQDLNSKTYHAFYPIIHHTISILAIGISRVFFSDVGEETSSIVFTLRLLFLFFEIGNLLLFSKLLKDKQDNDIKLYAWNPLVILEGIGNLHFEIPLLFFLLLGFYFYRKNYFFSSIGFSLSTGTKLLPILLYPYLILRNIKKPFCILGLILPLILVIGIYLYLLQDPILKQWENGFGLYSHSFEFFSFLNYYLRVALSAFGFDFQSLGIWIWGVTGILYIILLAVFIRKNKSSESFFFYSLSLILLFSPVVHPWYLIPWTGMGILLGKKFLIPAGFFAFSSYIYYVKVPYTRDDWVVASAYILFFLVAAGEFYEHKYNWNLFRLPCSIFRNFS